MLTTTISFLSMQDQSATNQVSSKNLSVPDVNCSVVGLSSIPFHWLGVVYTPVHY